MTVFIVTPTFNRVDHLHTFISQLQSQKSVENLKFILVDSGSTDGSIQLIQSMMKSDSRFELVTGKNNWWWARAAHEGLAKALQRATADDIIVLLNDDVRIAEDFIEIGCQLLRQHPKSIWGSALRVDTGETELAVMRDLVDFSVYALQNVNLPEPYEQDLVSGRGAFFPVSVFSDGANIRYKKLPHYLADYDLSSQAKKLGYSLLGSSKLFVASGSEFGNSHSRNKTLSWKIFATQSAFRLVSQYHFWHSESGFSKGRTAVLLLWFRLRVLIMRTSKHNC